MGNHDTRKPADYIKCGFAVALRRPILYEPRVILMHEPPLEGDVMPGMIYIFGHTHNNIMSVESLPNCICVCVEKTNYKPIDLQKLVAEKKKINHII